MRLHLAVAALAAAPVAAQGSSSSNYRLLSLALDGSGGGSASSQASAFLSVGAVAGGELASAGHRARLGPLGIADPHAGAAPVVLGTAPAFGPREGGTSLAVHGLNLAGAGVSVELGGSAATETQVVSGTLIQCASPAGSMGKAAVAVHANGQVGTLPDGFLYTPAVVTPASVALGGALEVVDYGPVGGAFSVYASTVTTSLPLPPWGELLIGPKPLWKLVSDKPYPGPDGVHHASLPVPDDVALHGVELHFQSLAVLSFAPLELALTNRSSTLLL